METIPENLAVDHQSFQEVKPSKITMCSKTLRGANIFYYLGFYVSGAMFLGLVTYFFVHGGPIYRMPNMDTKTEEMFKCFGDALLSYTLTYNIWCHTATLRWSSERPIISGLSLVFSFGMMIALASLLFYSTIQLWILLTCCFMGAGVGGLFLRIVSILNEKPGIKKQADDCMTMEESGRKTPGSTSCIEEAEKEEDIV